LEKRLQDRGEEKSELELHPYLNIAIDAIEEAAEGCEGLPLPQSYATPLDRGQERGEGGYPNWVELHKEEKLRVIEELFAEEIRPYIELDQGGVKVVDL